MSPARKSKPTRFLPLLCLIGLLVPIAANAATASKKSAPPSAAAEPTRKSAATSLLRITCEGESAGAEIHIDGKFKGECPLDVQVPEGTLKLRVLKNVDESFERVFEQDVRMGDGVVKKIEVELPAAPRLNAAVQKREEQRLLADRAAAPQRDARNRAAFDAALTSGSIKASFRDCADCPEMVSIPPGSFEMGSNNGEEREKPAHRVFFAKAIAIGKTEVTQGQWKAVMGRNPSYFSNCGDRCAVEGQAASGGVTIVDTGKGGLCGDDCPVELVNWEDVQVFLQKLNAKTGKQYRLPSEAEWEYACRGGEQQEYCGSDNADAVAWWGKSRYLSAPGDPEGNSGHRLHSVATKQANRFGLHDMSGNVAEWVEDGYHLGYLGAPTDGSVWRTSDKSHVLRGGDWDTLSRSARAARRGNTSGGTLRDETIGFRLARDLP